VKQGDYVTVMEGVHDDSMPFERRDGLIVEVVGSKNDQAIVMFSNQSFLKFHQSQLKILVKS
jgi:hypothetical protein